MTGARSSARHDSLDHPWRRLPLLTLASVTAWSGILYAFGFYLGHTHIRPAPALDQLQASIIEVSGLAGGGGGSPGTSHQGSPAPKSVAVHAPAPVAHKTPHRATQRRTTHHLLKPVVESALPQLHEMKRDTPPAIKDANAKIPSPAGVGTRPVLAGRKDSLGGGGSGSGTRSGTGSGAAPGSGSGSGGSFGSGGNGPRAIYAPVPTIPEDLRDEVMEATAVVLFHVSREGKATVSLVEPTEFSELNDLIIQTLKEWRFRPAFKGGVAVDSAAEVRLRITVQ